MTDCSELGQQYVEDYEDAYDEQPTATADEVEEICEGLMAEVTELKSIQEQRSELTKEIERLTKKLRILETKVEQSGVTPETLGNMINKLRMVKFNQTNYPEFWAKKSKKANDEMKILDRFLHDQKTRRFLEDPSRRTSVLESISNKSKRINTAFPDYAGYAVKRYEEY